MKKIIWVLFLIGYWFVQALIAALAFPVDLLEERFERYYNALYEWSHS